MITFTEARLLVYELGSFVRMRRYRYTTPSVMINN